MQALYTADESAVLIDPSGQELAFNKHQGLNYIDWDTFEEIRGQLKKSHLEGRVSLTEKPEKGTSCGLCTMQSGGLLRNPDDDPVNSNRGL